MISPAFVLSWDKIVIFILIDKSQIKTELAVTYCPWKCENKCIKQRFRRGKLIHCSGCRMTGV